MIELKGYQTKATKRAVDLMLESLREEEHLTIVLQACTGSGKTLMQCSTFQGVNAKSPVDVCAIYVSLRGLPDQSKKKFEQYSVNNGFVKYIDIDSNSIRDNRIYPGEAFFINWEKMNKPSNKFMSDNETNFNLENVINNTKASGCRIILIIDEYQHTAGTIKSQDIIQKISPDITFKTSATAPKKHDYDELVKVKTSAVKKAGMIKNKLVTNPGIAAGMKNSDLFYLKKGWNKLCYLASLYLKLGIPITPLLIIQLPHATSEYTASVLQIVEGYLKTRGLSIDAIDEKKIAYCLANNKVNFDGLEELDCKIPVVITKDAMSIGYDCTRAQVIVRLRDSGNIDFDMQFNGRIMRMPEHKHYPIEDLNLAYVYHNSTYITITEDCKDDVSVEIESNRNDDIYEPIDLPFEYMLKNRERSSKISREYESFFLDEAKKQNLLINISLEEDEIKCEIGINGEVLSPDETGIIKEEIVKQVVDDPLQIEEMYYDLLNEICSSRAEKRNSIKRLKTIHRDFFNDSYDGFPLRGADSISKIQRVILSNIGNVHLIKNVHTQALEKYDDFIGQKKQREIIMDVFNVPQTQNFKSNSKHTHIDASKSIMQPLYILEVTDPERGFVKWLQENPNVKWFFKNGTKGKETKYFSISYIDADGEQKLFYPDWIVMYNDGRIGIYDTKDGDTAIPAAAACKIDTLYNYIKQESKSRSIHGGIIIAYNNMCYVRCCTKKEYHYDKNRHPIKDGWEIFDVNYDFEKKLIHV